MGSVGQTCVGGTPCTSGELLADSEGVRLGPDQDHTGK